jgi:tRNA threonylcarbamoyl adenosine modification protein (Sua5/YciO/YrdC/YwlC family)
MAAKVISIDADNIKSDVLSELKDAFFAGKIVAFPTETVYGIGVISSDAEAVKRIYAVKKRDSSKPLGIYIHSLKQLFDLCPQVDPCFRSFADTFLPGPVTVLVNDAGGKKIGIRYCDHPVLLKILESLPEVIVGTSANMSDCPACVKPQDVFRQLKDDIDYIIDGGVTKYRGESSIIDFTQTPVEIIRSGAAIEAVLDYFNTNDIAYCQKKTILVVCTGNTCRSPMVEAYVRSRLAEYAPHAFLVESCGIYAPEGVSASPDAVKVLGQAGLDISNHRSRSIEESMVRAASRIIVMTEEHKHMLRAMYPNIDMDICVLDIPDPIGRGTKIYEQTFAKIKSKIKEKFQWIIQ